MIVFLNSRMVRSRDLSRVTDRFTLFCTVLGAFRQPRGYLSKAVFPISYRIDLEWVKDNDSTNDPADAVTNSNF